MAAPRGTRPPNAGKGRKRGPNKLTAQVKELVEGALADVGGRDYLARQARKNPKAFLVLVSKLIPRDLNVSAEVRHTLVDLIAASHQPQSPRNEQPPASSLPN